MRPLRDALSFVLGVGYTSTSGLDEMEAASFFFIRKGVFMGSGVLLGFDPGGKGNFGWCILEDSDGPLKILASNVSDNALNTMEVLKKDLPPQLAILGAGIDAPLFWVPSGDRMADKTIRKKITNKSTVLSPNSLRGACLIQGIMIAVLLRKDWGKLPITEAHPKAFLHLIKNSDQKIKLSDLNEYFMFDKQDIDDNNENIRDAAIAGYFAWAMFHKKADWQDLFPQDLFPKEDRAYMYTPIEQPLGYWFPKR